MAKFGFIGMGNMASAIMNGLLKSYAPGEILFSSVTPPPKIHRFLCTSQGICLFKDLTFHLCICMWSVCT